ncbi:MAG: TIGR03032 family protein [Planctomycetota bacterium]
MTERSQNLATRQINYRQSAQFVPILEHLGCSLLLSTYAAGKVISVGASGGKLHFDFSNFQQAMGIATPSQTQVDSGAETYTNTLAVGTSQALWFLRDGEALAKQVEPAGEVDRIYLARQSFVTGNIAIHEMAWGSNHQLWVVNTLFSCLATLHPDYNFVHQWMPPFISELAPEDRCHLNGLAMRDGEPAFVSALGSTDSARGWRESKSAGGIVMSVADKQIIASGFCMPHSPRFVNGKLFVLDSGRGKLVTVDLNSGGTTDVAEYPGYGRGLTFAGQFAFVGMSKARETSVFGGVPICQNREAMRCGVVVVDLTSGRCVAFLEFETGVDELFDVQVIHDSRRTVLHGPFPKEDQRAPVWVVPPAEQVDRLRERGKETDFMRILAGKLC